MLDLEEPTDEELMEAGEEPSTSSKEEDKIFRRLKMEFRKDIEHWAPWYKKAKEWYGMYGGDQWEAKDLEALKAKKRPAVTFNRVMPTINVVSGHEISNRQEIIYYPRNMGTVRKSEYLSSACRWWRDTAECEDMESAGFRDTLICGMGWQHPRMDYEEKPTGVPACDRIDPLEMVVDRFSQKANCTDAKRVFRVRVVPLGEAMDMFPEAKREQLHAAWADATSDGDPAKVNGMDRYQENKDSDPAKIDDAGTVTLVECHWAERIPVYVIRNPQTGQPQELEEEKYKALESEIKGMGGDPKKLLQAHKAMKTVRWKTFLGAKVLEHGPTACPDHFGYQCITGLWDQTSRTWFGLVLPMVDPQRWANKFLSQTIHIMNTTAKGGVMAEIGAIDDQKKFKESWAQSDEVTFVKNGSLKDGKIQPKPVNPYPQGLDRLAEVAFNAIRDSTGVNQEMLGLRDANQPGVLEYQRKQAGMTIIAAFFDSLRRYRKIAGKMILYYIQNDIPDGTIIRVLGPEGKKLMQEMMAPPQGMGMPGMDPGMAGGMAPPYGAPGAMPPPDNETAEGQQDDQEELNIPLLRDKTAGDFDIVVDEAPTSPNVKDRTWSLLQPLFQQLPPDLQLVMIKYAPLPEAAIKELQTAGQAAMAKQQEQGDPKVEAAKQLAEITAQQKQQEMMLKQQEHEAELMHKQKLAEMEFAFKEREMAMKAKQQELDMQAKQAEAAFNAQNEYNKNRMMGDFAREQQEMKRGDMEHDFNFKRRAREEEASIGAQKTAPAVAEAVLNPLAEVLGKMHETMESLNKRSGAKNVIRDPKTNRIMRVELAD